MLDPTIGRYTQPDPLLVGGPRLGHPYLYAWQNPVRFLDPSGLDWFADPGAYDALKTVSNGPLGPQMDELGRRKNPDGSDAHMVVRHASQFELKELGYTLFGSSRAPSGMTLPQRADGTIEILYNDCLYSERSARGGRSENLSVLLAHEMGHPWGAANGAEFAGYPGNTNLTTNLTWSYTWAGRFENIQRAAEGSPSFVPEDTHNPAEQKCSTCVRCDLCD